MSKQWECKDCVKQGTDACYFAEVEDGYKYCHDIVVDTDYAYEQGRADAIEEFANTLIDYIVNEKAKGNEPYWTNAIRYVATELKEHKQ